MVTYVECTGMAISSWPKKSFWNPSAPGLMIPATDGVSLPITKLSYYIYMFILKEYK